MPGLLNQTDKRDDRPVAQNGGLWRAMRRFPFAGPAPGEPRLARRASFLMLLVASAVFGVMVALVGVFSITLPQMAELERYRPDTTTELYDIHGKIFGSFAIERRIVVPYSEFPPVLREAILSIEDKNFETNGGVNLLRVLGAAYADLHSDRRSQGASTLTMQLARNLFLSSQKTYTRKLEEIFLTLQIERHFTKQQIFTLYANQIYLGGGTYGFEAGSEYYFSKHARDLTLPEAALLAALPKGPEEFSPVRHPERALRRRNLVINEMLLDHKISDKQAEAAEGAPLGLKLEAPENTQAPYFVEEVRRQLEREYGVDEVHGAGLRVYTTLDLNLQHAAEKAVLDGLATYERRHGWKGHLENVLAEGQELDAYKHPDWTEPIAEGAYFHALVTEVSRTRMTVRIGDQTATMTYPDWAWTGRSSATDLAKAGDIVYVKVTNWSSSGGPSDALHVVLEQDSGAQGSLMAMDNANGEVLAMVGGRDFDLSQFNRATQAERQVGSSFKIYDYTAAMEAGMKPYDTVLDVPTTFYTPGGPYTPHDYERGEFSGSMTLIDAFAQSRNIPALRLADKLGIKRVIAVAHQFGVTSDLPDYLPVAIGAADISLAEQVGAYSVFPNDGIRITPHYIRRVVDPDGSPIEQRAPKVHEVISVDIAREMMQMLQAVTHIGTAAAVSSMDHAFGGKTGTTNNYTDAWFVGFSPSITCGTWVGFDDRRSLGEKETGARAALPIWMEFMKVAVADRPNEQFSRPNAPKKKLDVDLTQAAAPQDQTATPVQPATDDNDSSASALPPPPQSAAPPPVNQQTPDDSGPASTAPGPPAGGSGTASPSKQAAPISGTAPQTN